MAAVVDVLSITAPKGVSGGPSAHAGWDLYGKFAAFVTTLRLRHFTADELLYLGEQNNSGACKGLNEYPAEILWNNIVPTVSMLDRLQEDLRAPVRLLSVYRSPAYNRCIDGADINSLHMRFQAIDFVCDIGTPDDWASRLREYRTRSLFSGGIGVYKAFVHVDSGGANKNWKG